MLIRRRAANLQRNASISIRSVSTITAKENVVSKPVVVRFAPSPTGHLHLGGLRTALFNHLFARKHGGRWILRIEDTDRSRYVPGAIESMQDTLKWAGLEYDEGPDLLGTAGPYLQSQRLDLYNQYIERLLNSGHAYRDLRPPLADANASSREKLSGNGKDTHVVRLRMPQADTRFDDLVYGTMRIPFDRSRDDPVLVKSDGWPTYHLANVVDDTEMGISHVLRGEEWLPSMPIHLALYDALDMQSPQFVHLPLLINPDGSKLSKRHADVHVESYRKQGFEPEALLNFVALMGFNWQDVAQEHESHSEVFSVQDMIERFSLERISQSRACPDMEKLKYLNRQHLTVKVGSIKSDEGASEVQRKLLHAIEQSSDRQNASFSTAQLDLMIGVFLKRAQSIKESAEEIAALLSKPHYEASLWSTLDGSAASVALQVAHDGFASASEPLDTIDRAEQCIKRSAKEFTKVKSSDAQIKPNRATFMKALRFALTGKQSGATLAEIVALLGKVGAKERIKACQQWSLDRS